eukprot:9469756-Pyramimonas_sp.AAC.1
MHGEWTPERCKLRQIAGREPRSGASFARSTSMQVPRALLASRLQGGGDAPAAAPSGRRASPE